MKAYLSYFKLRVLTTLQYRADAIAGFITQLVFAIIQILIYLAFYQSSKTGKTPMELKDLITYIWLLQAFFAMVFPYEKDYELIEKIRNGNLAYDYIRPQNIFIKYFVKMFSGKLTKAFARAIPIIVVGFLVPSPYGLSLPKSPINFLIFLIALIGGSLLLSSISIMMHIFTMFTVDDKGVLGFYSTFADVFSGISIPIPFFPGIIKKIAMLLPFRYITDFPFRIYSGNISIKEGLLLLSQSFIWFIISIFLGLLINKLAFKKAVVQGG